MQDREPLRRKLILDGDIESLSFLNVLKALDSLNRLRILKYLWDKVASISDIAAALDIPASTVALHAETLEEAGLIRTELEPANRGIQKVCIRMFDQIQVNLPCFDMIRDQTIEIQIPIGTYTAFEATPTCGLASVNGVIGIMDDPVAFYELNRAEAQLIWFKQGYLEYCIPNRLPAGVVPETLRLSVEMCSEAPQYDLNWPSDITLWINGVEIGTWTSPADFGGEQGKLTPEWWPLRNCQYGLLKEWYVNERESGIDGRRISGVKLADLGLQERKTISIRLGVKPDAKNVGGLNLFGRYFGNHAQDIILWLSYHQNTSSNSTSMNFEIT